MWTKTIIRPKETNPARLLVRRDHVLDYASRLTIEKTNPAAVVANAKILLDWMLVPDAADQDARYQALFQAHHNRTWDREPDDAPELLIAEAEVYYAFLRAG